MKIIVQQWSMAFLIAWCTLPASAQDSSVPSGRKEVRRQMQTYVQEHVMPVMRTQRDKLDAQLAADDRNKLASLRKELKSLREAHKSVHGEKGEPREKRTELTEAQQKERRALHYRWQIVMGQVAELSQKYDAQIQALLKEVSGQRDQWQADLKALREADSTRQRRPAHTHVHHRVARGQFMPGGELWQPETFLLWAPSDPIMEKSLGTQAPDTEPRLFPNPTSGAARIAYAVEKAGTVKIEVLDRQGRVGQTLQDEQLPAGSYEKQVDLSALKGEAYFYRITTPDGVQTRKFVRQ